MPFETRPNDPGRALAWTGKTWMGDCDGDMTLEFDGQTWLVKEEVVSAHFRWLSTDFPNRAQVRLAHDASRGWPVFNGLQGDHIVVPPHISKRTHPAIFGLILEFLHTNQFRRDPWEDAPSFLTYVQVYFVAEDLGIDTLKASMVEHVEALSWHVLSLRDAWCPLVLAEADLEEEEHLMSFLDAVQVMERREWSPRMQKAIYDAGERLRDRLMELPAFRAFVEGVPTGRCFTRAIGLGRL